MISVIVVDDDATKYGRVHGVLVAGGVEAKNIKHSICVADALESIRERSFDLMLLDVNLPRRLGEGPVRGGGLEVLRELSRDDGLRRPRYIVGLTAFEDIVDEFGASFQDHLWSLVHYSENSDRWISQLRMRTEYIRATKESENFSDGVTYGIDELLSRLRPKMLAFPYAARPPIIQKMPLLPLKCFQLGTGFHHAAIEAVANHNSIAG